MQYLSHLYHHVDNLQCLRHPLWLRTFTYMSDRKVISLADCLTDTIIASGMKVVVVAETGASPYAEICQRILAYKGHQIIWKPVKFPREPVSSILPTVAFFLREEEKNTKLSPEQIRLLSTHGLKDVAFSTNDSRFHALEKICAVMPSDFYSSEPVDLPELLNSVGQLCQTSFQKSLSTIFSGTEIAELLKEPFIYFDEYIDSGTTFRNALTFFRCFVAQADLKTATYYISLPAPENHPKVLHTHCSVEDKPHCFDKGAYPYENRVDLIGHFYHITADTCTRVDLSSIIEKFDNVAHGTHQQCHEFLHTFTRVIGRNKLFDVVSARSTLPEVRDFLKIEHIVRHCLFQLEQKTGQPEFAEFLFQLFDMYGPAWTPMPVSFHFDFWECFRGFDKQFEQIPEYSALCEHYLECRHLILTEAAQICLSRRNEWLAEVCKELEELYGKQHDYNTGKSAELGIYSR